MGDSQGCTKKGTGDGAARGVGRGSWTGTYGRAFVGRIGGDWGWQGAVMGCGLGVCSRRANKGIGRKSGKNVAKMGWDGYEEPGLG